MDVLTQDLALHFGYGFPPASFAAPLLFHLRHCRARAVLVLPSRVHVWTPLVVGALVGKIPITNDFVPFAFESTRNGLVPSQYYNGVPYCAYLLDFDRAQHAMALGH